MRFDEVKEMLKRLYTTKKGYYEESVELFKDLLERLNK